MKMHIKIMILILIINRIKILTKTLWYATNLVRYLQYLNHNFLLLNFMLESLS